VPQTVLPLVEVAAVRLAELSPAAVPEGLAAQAQQIL
jgi:hypothetical protein